MTTTLCSVILEPIGGLGSQAIAMLVLNVEGTKEKKEQGRMKLDEKVPTCRILSFLRPYYWRRSGWLVTKMRLSFRQKIGCLFEIFKEEECIHLEGKIKPP